VSARKLWRKRGAAAATNDAVEPKLPVVVPHGSGGRWSDCIGKTGGPRSKRTIDHQTGSNWNNRFITPLSPTSMSGNYIYVLDACHENILVASCKSVVLNL